jgi:protein TonB
MRRITGALLVPLLALGACGDDESLQLPQPLGDAAAFSYPVDLWDRGTEGETVLLVHVDELGNVDSAAVHTPSGYAAFDSAAVAGVRKLRFAPARLGDERVDAWARIPVRFDRDSVPTPTIGALEQAP